MKTKLFITLLLVSSLVPFCNSKDKAKCDLREIKTLFTIPSFYEGRTAGHIHYILIKDFQRECLDSTMMVDIALRYMDTVKAGQPASVLHFFNSDKDFIPNETSQVMSTINKSCLVTIGFYKRTNKPNDFLFYDDKGKSVYWGYKWRPKGE